MVNVVKKMTNRTAAMINLIVSANDDALKPTSRKTLLIIKVTVGKPKAPIAITGS